MFLMRTVRASMLCGVHLDQIFVYVDCGVGGVNKCVGYLNIELDTKNSCE